MAPRRLRLPITDHRLAITATDSGFSAELAGLAASERLAAPELPPRWRPWALPAAVLLHVLVIFLLIYFARQKLPQEETESPDISVVFDHGGEQQTTAPPAQRQGPDQAAEQPPPPPPPPPPQQQMEVNLNMPPMPQGEVQSAPQAAPQPAPHPRPAPPAPPHYAMMMNGMSYGTPAPQQPNAPTGLSLSLPESDTQAVMASDFSVKGDAGPDYMAELHHWVEEHGYYPTAAAEQGQEGNAVVEFTVDRNGHVTDAHLLQSSGSTFIDQAWYQLFADNQLPPFPPGAKDNQVTIDYTGEFQLIR